jgi:hypothetical protein
MRHQQLENQDSFDIVDPAKAWPNGPNVQALKFSELGASTCSTTAAPDMPVAAGGLLAATYGALLAAFPLLITHDRSSFFAIAIAAFYLVMFFAIPAIFFRIEGDTSRRPELSDFLEHGMHTATGHISGKGALAQMLVVPVLLTFAILAMGITYLLV